MQRAYVLIETEREKTKDVVDVLRKVSGITADIVMGPYDVITVVQRENANAVCLLILNEVRRVPGIIKTMTCLAVES